MSEALATQLDKANKKITDLEARLRAYRARLAIAEGTEAHPHRGDPNKVDQEILEELAGALQLAAVAELAHSTSPIHDGPPSRSKRDNEAPIPGSGTHLPRSRARELRKDVSEALGRFWWSSENDWKRKPHPRAEIPKLRCGNRSCPAYGINADAWYTVRGGKTIYREVCASCGMMYPKPEEAA
jgi:hypothetical protein